MSHPKRPNDFTASNFVLSYDHVAVTADTTFKLWKLGRKFVLDRAYYVNVTGLAADVTNFYNIKVNIAAVLALNWSTETGEEGTIAADTFVTMDPAAAAARIGAADAEISLELDEDGTQTLPAGRIVIEGRYL